jgi:tetratricopeptide (TPR) repeat protein
LQSVSVAPTELMTRTTAQHRRPPSESRASPSRGDRPRPGVFRASEVDPTRRGWLLPALACIVAFLAGGAWLAYSGGGSESDEGTAAKRQAADRKQTGGSPKTSATATGATPETSATATGAAPNSASPAAVAAPSAAVSDPTAGAQLNEEGYALIQGGRYAEAIPLLRRAVASFPEGTTDINFAYALFNLGHALRMVGQPEEAIPILERRLQIPDQTETVQRELDAARAAARL